MGQADYQRVLAEMRLADGHLFPIPITLPVGADHGFSVGEQVALRSAKNKMEKCGSVGLKAARRGRRRALPTPVDRYQAVGYLRPGGDPGGRRGDLQRLRRQAAGVRAGPDPQRARCVRQQRAAA